jgi:hypothetical protein
MKFSCIQSRFLFCWTLQWKGTLLLLADLPARLSTSDLFLLKKLVTMRKCMHVCTQIKSWSTKNGSISINFMLHAHICVLHILLKRISSLSSTTSSSSSLPSFFFYTDMYARVKATDTLHLL